MLTAAASFPALVRQLAFLRGIGRVPLGGGGVMIRLRALGECVIEIGDRQLGPDAEVIFALLVYLIVERGRPISRAELIGLFWPDYEDANARHCLRQSVYKLRRMGVPIETRFGGYVLAANVAAADFDSVATISRALGNFTSSRGVSVFIGFAPAASEAYLNWLEQLRDRAQANVRQHLVKCLTDARNHNRWEESAHIARKCLELDPLNEEATLTLAEAAALTGSKTGALQILDSYLAEVGHTHTEIRLPASVLRRRISERVSYAAAADVSQSVFVGRADILQLLQQTARETSAGAGYTCVVHGEPGIGKTRLASEFTNVAALSGHRVIRSHCRADTQDRSLSMLTDLAPPLLRLPGALGCSPDALTLVRRLGEHDATARLGHGDYQDMSALHDALRQAVRELIDAVTSEHPLVLWIEDVHWIDPVSRSLLRELVASNRTRPLMLLLTSREDEASEFLRGLDRRQMLTHHLQGLPQASARQLALHLCTALGVEASTELLDWAVTHGAGNPLHIVELISHRRDNGASRTVPPSLEALVDERLSRLSQAGLRVLQTAALLGPHATLQCLEALLAFPRWQFLSAMEELDTRRVASCRNGVITPLHDLLANAAVSRLGTLARSALHASIANYLETTGNANADIGLLRDAARHWRLATSAANALAVVQRCVAVALDADLPDIANDVLLEALAGTSVDSERLALYNIRRECLRQAGFYKAVAENCLEAVAIERRSSHLMTSHTANEIALLMSSGLPYATGRAHVTDHVLSCAQASDATNAHRLEAAAWGLAACSTDCLLMEARSIRAAIADISPNSPEEKRHFLNCSLIFESEFGSLDAAVTSAYELVAFERQWGSPLLLSRALRVASWPLRFVGLFATVHEYLEESARICRTHNLSGDLILTQVVRAQAFCNEGLFNESATILREAVHAVATRPQLTVPALNYVAAETAVELGRMDDARHFLTKLAEVTDPPRRHISDRLALEIELALRTNAEVLPSTVAALRDLHEDMAHFAEQDFVVSALCGGLMALGRSPEAARVGRQYVMHSRRELWPVRHTRLLSVLDNTRKN